MVYSQIQQIQQRIGSASQLLSQLCQSEEGKHQKLMQLAQDESFTAQQLQRAQQMCQESISSLQSISGSLRQQSFSPSHTQTGFYGQGLASSPTMHTVPQSPSGSGALFNLATMSPETIQGTTQYMGAPGFTGMGATGSTFGTKSPLSDVSTMGPSTYRSSREQLGQGVPSLSQIGQQAGISTNQ